MASETLRSDTPRNRAKKVWGPTDAKRIAINSFLVFHILAITCWCLPIDSTLISLCKGRVRPYFVWSGLFQSWDMFSPLPKSANTYIQATSVYKAGSGTTRTFPQLYRLSLAD